MKRNTVAWWIKFYHMHIDLWNVYTNKWGMPSLTVGCYDESDPFSSHTFDF